jgi:UDP-N-acetyl-D-mannosaminuronate dehydrogenase
VAQDPLVTDWPELDMTVARELPPATDVDAVVLAVPHRVYRDWDVAEWLAGATPIVLDANAVLTPAQRRDLSATGVSVHAIGAGRRP